MKISKVKELVKLGENTSLNYFRYKENNEEIIFSKVKIVNQIFLTQIKIQL